MGRGIREFKGSITGDNDDDDDDVDDEPSAPSSRSTATDEPGRGRGRHRAQGLGPAMARLTGRPNFDDRLTLVEHLDELRTRIIVSGRRLRSSPSRLCFWQNALLLDIANAPLPGDRVPITFGVDRALHHDRDALGLRRADARDAGDPLPALRLRPARASRRTSGASSCRSCSWSRSCSSAGVVFAYFVVIPAATSSFSTSTPTEFNIEVRARDYYSFFALTLIAVGRALPDPGRRARGDAARDRHPRAARRATAATRCSRSRSWRCCCPGPTP